MVQEFQKPGSFEISSSQWILAHCVFPYTNYTSEGKLIALFLRTMDSVLHADLIGNSTFPSTTVQYSTNPAVYTTELYNNIEGTRFYIIRHTDTNSLDQQTFDLRINTNSGEKRLKGLHLNRRESRILVTDYSAGSHQISYSTAELLTWQTIDGIDTIFYLIGDRQQSIEIAFAYDGDGNDIRLYHEGAVDANAIVKDNIATLSFTPDLGQEIVSIRIDETFNIIALNRDSAYKLWAPVLQHGPRKINPEDQVLVQGPYLVRNVTAEGLTLHLVGDVNGETSMLLWTTARFTQITWNGELLHIEEGPFMSRRAILAGPDKNRVKLPSLNTTETEWKVMDSLPEIHTKYDDSQWIVARDSSTNEVFPPLTLPCLYAGEYGYHTGLSIDLPNS